MKDFILLLSLLNFLCKNFQKMILINKDGGIKGPGVAQAALGFFFKKKKNWPFNFFFLGKKILASSLHINRYITV